MARTVTLTQLRGWVRSKGDWPDANFVTDTELTDEINAGIASLHRLIAAAKGYEYFRTTVPLATDPGIDVVNLPVDFYELLGLWWDQGNGIKVPIRRYMPNEGENQIQGEGWAGTLMSDNVRYSIALATLRFVPTPQAIHSLKLEYIVAPVRLVGGGDSWDGYAGFEEYPVWYTVATFLQKEESDPSVALARMSAIERDIMSTVTRDRAEPVRAQDLRGWPMGRRMNPARWR